MNAIICETKERRVPLTIGGKTYNVALTLNCIEQLQERYGELENVFGASSEVKQLKWILAVFINDAVDAYNDDHDVKLEHVTESYIGRKIDIGNISEYTDVLMQTFGVSLPTAEELPEDDELNAAVDAVAEAAGLEEAKNSQAE